VLAIIDMSSQSRFWTQFEAWMAMQSCSQHGLQPAPSDKRRCQISCIHSAEPGKDDKKMMELWAQRKPAEAHELLKARDVAVTNQTDKDLWLPLIFQLDAAVKNAFTVSQAQYLHHKGARAVDLGKAGFTLQQLKEVGYNFTQLKDAFPAQLKEVYSFTELKEAGLDVLMKAGYTATQLKEEGYSARELHAASRSAQELRKVGYSAEELREAGYSFEELNNAGYTPLDLLDTGYEIGDLFDAGYSAQEIDETCMDAEDLRVFGFVPRMDAKYTKELRELGATPEQLCEAGFSVQAMMDAGYTRLELIDAGYSPDACKSPLDW